MTTIYSNYFVFNNRTFAYKDKVLFDITDEPKALFCSSVRGYFGYWIDSQWLDESHIKKILINKPYIKILNDPH